MKPNYTVYMILLPMVTYPVDFFSCQQCSHKKLVEVNCSLNFFVVNSTYISEIEYSGFVFFLFDCIVHILGWLTILKHLLVHKHYIPQSFIYAVLDYFHVFVHFLQVCVSHCK